jgi:hypothetical protein
MNKNVTTIIVDLGVLLVLVAISFGIWFYPWITALVLVLLLIGGCLCGQDSR